MSRYVLINDIVILIFAEICIFKYSKTYTIISNRFMLVDILKNKIMAVLLFSRQVKFEYHIPNESKPNVVIIPN